MCDPSTTGQANSGYQSTSCSASADTVCTGRYSCNMIDFRIKHGFCEFFIWLTSLTCCFLIKHEFYVFESK